VDVVVAVGEHVVEALNAIGSHQETIEGAEMSARAAGVGLSWVRRAAASLRPLINDWYRGTSKGAQDTAGQNLVDAAEEIADKIDEYVDAGRLTEEQGRQAFDDPAKHELLAALIAERMTKTSDSAEAVFIALASAALKHLGSRQLRLLGAILVTRYWEIDEFASTGSDDGDFAHYVECCNVEVRPHWDVQIMRQDIDHLEMLSLLRATDQHLTRRLVGGRMNCPMLSYASHRFQQQATLWQTPVFLRLNDFATGGRNAGGQNQPHLAFQFLELSPAGLITGAAMHYILRGLPIDLGKWE